MCVCVRVCALVTARSKEKTVNCCVHQKGCSGSVVRVTPVVQSSPIGEWRASVTCAQFDNSSLPAAAISVATNTWLDSSALANSAYNLATHTQTRTLAVTAIVSVFAYNKENTHTPLGTHLINLQWVEVTNNYEYGSTRDILQVKIHINNIYTIGALVIDW